MAQDDAQVVDKEWVGFPGGELEGKPPRVLCAACREAREASKPLTQAAGGRRSAVANQRPGWWRSTGSIGHATRNQSTRARTLCFQCYRAELDRHRAVRAAGRLNTGSEERFQSQLPFEPVDKPRLQMLKAGRSQARVLNADGPGGFAGRRRQAQIAARHAVRAVAAGGRAGQTAASAGSDVARAMAAAIHAAELQLPESWLPFVVAR